MVVKRIICCVNCIHYKPDGVEGIYPKQTCAKNKWQSRAYFPEEYNPCQGFDSVPVELLVVRKK
jgi:hypothetical protein